MGRFFLEVVLFVATTCVGAARKPPRASEDVELRDLPVVGSEAPVYLDGNDWFATSSSGISIPASVPGDLISDLYNAGVVGDPIFEDNWRNSSLWNDHVWTYTKPFATPSIPAGGRLLVVLDGVKMAAEVKLNGYHLFSPQDQFVRYYADVTDILSHSGNNTLTVSFHPSESCDGRFMACTGGWDWAPVSGVQQPANPGDAFVLSKGIWRSVYLVPTEGLAILDCAAQVYYLGDYPTAPLEPSTMGAWNVKFRARLWAPEPVKDVPVNLTIEGQSVTDRLSAPAGESFTAMQQVLSSESELKLWWPHGVGPDTRRLYDGTISIQSAPDAAVAATRRFGLRTFALVTGNDTDPEYVTKSKGADGTSEMGMLFRVNGAAIWSRGANVIPTEQYEGRLSSVVLRQLASNAVLANLNTLRVWGGGVFLPDAFYDAADELGILIYHDMQYAQSGHSPARTATQAEELRHQVLRLGSHPSIVIWDGCNECQVVLNTSTGIYADFVLKTVAEQDDSRSIWPSCPAQGWQSGVHRLTSTPNGSPAGLNPRKSPLVADRDGFLLQEMDPSSGLSKPIRVGSGATPIEEHGPYQHGSGFPTANGDPTLQLFESNIPNFYQRAAISIAQPNVYASEFGCSVFSSFESMSPTLSPNHWGIHAGLPGDSCVGGFNKNCTGNNPMSQRNYPGDSIIDVYFGTSDFDEVGEQAFKKQLWQNMIGQALNLKQNIEARRSTNSFGMLVWQFNEIWPTGGWGSIEYGTPVAGQVTGGRWKPLHFWYKSSLFADVLASCGGDGLCYLRNDQAMRSFNGTLQITAHDLVTGHSQTLMLDEAVVLPPGPGAVRWLNVDFNHLEPTSSVVVATVWGAHGAQVSTNVLTLTEPKHLAVAADATVTVQVADSRNEDGSVDITVGTDAPAMYVTLTAGIDGQFSDNAFFLPSQSRRTLTFLPIQGIPINPGELRSTIRVEHLGTYQG